MKSIQQVIDYIFEHETEDYIDFLMETFPDDADYIEDCRIDGNWESLDKYALNGTKEVHHIYVSAVRAHRALNNPDNDTEALPVFVRFENGQEDRQSPLYGPFEYAQLTYGTLRVKPVDGEEYELASLDGASVWVDNDGKRWSDVIF